MPVGAEVNIYLTVNQHPDEHIFANEGGRRATEPGVRCTSMFIRRVTPEIAVDVSRAPWK